MQKVAKRSRKRRPVAVFAIVPKSQMRAKKPAMLADPDKAVVIQLTPDVAKAATFSTRSGAFRRVTRTPELKKTFWYKRVR